MHGIWELWLLWMSEIWGLDCYEIAMVKSRLVNKDFQTWHLIGRHHSCQPIRSHVRKSLLKSWDFNMDLINNPGLWLIDVRFPQNSSACKGLYSVVLDHIITGHNCTVLKAEIEVAIEWEMIWHGSILMRIPSYCDMHPVFTWHIGL